MESRCSLFPPGKLESRWCRLRRRLGQATVFLPRLRFFLTACRLLRVGSAFGYAKRKGRYTTSTACPVPFEIGLLFTCLKGAQRPFHFPRRCVRTHRCPEEV